MRRRKVLTAHIIATSIAMITIVSFFSFSLWAELLGTEQDIKTVKAGILYALPILLIAMPVLGISGNKLAGKSHSPIILEKKRRMSWVFINGMFLISIAIALYILSRSSDFGITFLGLQILELVFGFTNIILIGLNIKNGLKLSGKLKKH